jgi:hypothetical protein
VTAPPPRFWYRCARAESTRIRRINRAVAKKCARFRHSTRSPSMSRTNPS